MKFIIDSANIEAIERLLALGFVSGITTNPSILKLEEKPRLEQVDRLLEFEDEDIYVQLVGLKVDDMYHDFLTLKDMYEKELKRFIFKIPINRVGLKVIKKINDKDPSLRILGTTIYTFNQALAGIMAGCESLAIYYNRILVSDEDPNGLIQALSQYKNHHNLDVTLVGASFKTTQQIQEAFMHGIDTCTVSPHLLEDLIEDERVKRDVLKFEKDHMFISEL